MMNIDFKEIEIQNIKFGKNNEIAIQSMVNIALNQKDELISQSRKLYQRGCKIIRFATSKSSEIEELNNLKPLLKKQFPEIILVADTHFSPIIAELAVEVFDKVRINPGNFIDRNTGHKIYSEADFEHEKNKMELQLIPFLIKCQKKKIAIRIGTNHGSLSERILQKYGDTPEGMVASVDEMLAIAHKTKFTDIIISLKASSPKLMIEANRLMMRQMISRATVFPLHLGVTEAGNGFDGRIKSAVGIGVLLLNGIGDTIRVSLTEAPEKEINPAKIILNSALKDRKRNKINFENLDYQVDFPFDYPIVISNGVGEGDFFIEDEHLFLTKNSCLNLDFDSRIYTLENFISKEQKWQFVELDLVSFSASDFSLMKNFKQVIFLLRENIDEYYFKVKSFINSLKQNKLNYPLIFYPYSDEKNSEKYMIEAAVQLGSFLIDGVGNGLILENKNQSKENLISWSYSILQAAGQRRTKPEIIACPSCSRTRFDIEQMTNEIKSRLHDIPNIKISIMGCIINGLGEMADADYGFVGMGKERVNLYYKKQLIAQKIHLDKAIELFYSHLAKQENIFQ